MTQRPVQVIGRAVSVLNHLRSGPKGVTELSRLTGLKKSTVQRLLSTLEGLDLVAQDGATGAYSIGLGMVLLVQDALYGGSLRHYAFEGPTLELQQMTEETVTVHVRFGLDRLCIYERPSLHPIRYEAGVGATAPLNSGSAGKVLLAFLPEARREEILARLPLVRLTDRTITDREQLQSELDRVRRAGYALSAGERLVGAAAVSVPLHLPFGGRHEIAALSVLGPEMRMPAHKCEEWVPLLQKAARKIEANLRVSVPVEALT